MVKKPRSEESKAKLRQLNQRKREWLYDNKIRRPPDVQKRLERKYLILGGFLKPRYYRAPGRRSRKDKEGFEKSEISRSYGTLAPKAIPSITPEMLKEAIKRRPAALADIIMADSDNAEKEIITKKPKLKRKREILTSPILPKPLPRIVAKEKKKSKNG